ncbi:hypothetical protein FT670_05705 [Aeromonas jandaei]|nr:hypothetical protein FT670_05705 [Aeromonas jandaei]
MDKQIGPMENLNAANYTGRAALVRGYSLGIQPVCSKKQLQGGEVGAARPVLSAAPCASILAFLPPLSEPFVAGSS